MLRLRQELALSLVTALTAAVGCTRVIKDPVIGPATYQEVVLPSEVEEVLGRQLNVRLHWLAVGGHERVDAVDVSYLGEALRVVVPSYPADATDVFVKEEGRPVWHGVAQIRTLGVDRTGWLEHDRDWLPAGDGMR